MEKEGACLPVIGWGMGAHEKYVRPLQTQEMKDRRHRRSIIAWKICVYSAVQNHRFIYNSSVYNRETHTNTQNEKDLIFFSQQSTASSSVCIS